MPDEYETTNNPENVPDNERPNEPVVTIPNDQLENGYYWATPRGLENDPRQPVWVGFINGTPRVWCTGRRNSTRANDWSIIQKLECP